MKRMGMILGFAAAAMLWAGGCERERPAPTGPTAPERVPEGGAVEAEPGAPDGLGAVSEREQFVNQMRGRLAELGDDITDLKQHAAQAGGAAQQDRAQQFEQRATDLRAELGKLATATGEQWTETRARIQRELDDLRRELQQARQTAATQPGEQPEHPPQPEPQPRP